MASRINFIKKSTSRTGMYNIVQLEKNKFKVFKTNDEIECKQTGDLGNLAFAVCRSSSIH